MSEKNHVDLLRNWLQSPHKLGNAIGFTLLSDTHSDWIKFFLKREKMSVLQAHRNSYKTTSGLVAVLLYFMMYPDNRVMIVRKTMDMAQKIVSAMEKIFEHELVKAWFYSAYGVKSLKTMQWSRSAITLACKKRITAEPSLQASGINNARTGDHYDLVWADDIITVEDRYSKAERERTKNYVFELQNIVLPTGKIFFSGTPWHPEDAFRLLPEPRRYPIGSVEIHGIDDEWIKRKQKIIPKSLWAANYELKHVKDVDKEFSEPIQGEPPPGLTKYWYIDPAFGGADSTAIWEGCTDGELFYLTWAKMFRRSIAEKYDELEQLFWARDVAKVYYENVGAQKLVGVELERRRIPCEGVPSNTNKFARITAALKPVWQRLRFHPEVLKHNMAPTEPGEDAPLNPLIELLEYNINAQHDDSPDACAGLVTQLQASGEIDYDDILDIQRQIS